MTVVGWPEGWQEGMSCCFLGQSCNNTGRPELPIPPPPACSQGSAGIKERVNSGEASSLCLVRSESNDRGPVPPLPSLRLSWKPRLAGSREQWVPPWSLGPCPPHPPPSPCQAWHFPLRESKPKGAGLLDQGKELGSSAAGLVGTCSLGRWLQSGGWGMEPLWILQWVGPPSCQGYICVFEGPYKGPATGLDP